MGTWIVRECLRSSRGESILRPQGPVSPMLRLATWTSTTAKLPRKKTPLTSLRRWQQGTRKDAMVQASAERRAKHKKKWQNKNQPKKKSNVYLEYVSRNHKGRHSKIRDELKTRKSKA